MAQSIEIKKVSPLMEALALELITNPGQSNAELGKKFQRTPGWISILKNSDIFIDYYRSLSAKRTDAVVTTITDQARGLASMALDRIEQKLTDDPAIPLGDLVEVADVLLKRSGYAGDSRAPAPPMNPEFHLHVTKADLEESRASMRKPLELRGAQEAEVIEGTATPVAEVSR